MNGIFEFFKNKKMISMTILVVVGVLAIAGFYSTSAGKAEQPQTADVVVLNLTETVDSSGTLEAQPFAALNWKTGGVVQSVNVKPGQKVKKGSVLLSLQPDSTSANIASAQSDLVDAQEHLKDVTNSDSELAQAVIDLRDAEQEYEDKAGYLKYLQTNDNVPLIESYGWYKKSKNGGWTAARTSRHYRGPATESMLVEAENNAELARANMEDLQRKVDLLKNNARDIAAAQARVDAAQATVNSMSIIAPFDGQVLAVKHRAGDVVSAGDLSLKIADLDHLYVEADVDESDIVRVKLGAPVDITLDALPESKFSGTVTAVNPVGVISSGLVKYTVRIHLDNEQRDDFMPLGSTANIDILVKENAATLAVPITAIQNDTDGEYVWVVQADGSAKRIKVMSGAIVGELVVVTGNLKAGSHVQILARDNGITLPGFGGK